MLSFALHRRDVRDQIDMEAYSLSPDQRCEPAQRPLQRLVPITACSP
jgi:hypothetical protein